MKEQCFRLTEKGPKLQGTPTATRRKTVIATI